MCDILPDLNLAIKMQAFGCYPKTSNVIEAQFPITLNKTHNAPKVSDSFELPKMDEAIVVKEFDECKTWQKAALITISLSEIKFQSQQYSRHKRNLEVMSALGTVLPVRVVCNEELQIYEVQEGDDRCWVAKTLGYTHIPAIIWTTQKTQPFDDATMNKIRFKSKIRKQIDQHRKLFKNSIFHHFTEMSLTSDNEVCVLVHLDTVKFLKITVSTEYEWTLPNGRITKHIFDGQTLCLQCA